MHDIFLLSLRVPKCVARGIAIAESTYNKSSEGADLKSKEPRLRDWNHEDVRMAATPFVVHLKSKEPRLRDWNRNAQQPMTAKAFFLEIKRTSITRLKRETSIKLGCLFFTWNQKNLDYEIETCCRRLQSERRLQTWNQKNLDYEIETSSMLKPMATFLFSWNQKNLDYEIETAQHSLLPQSEHYLEIKRTSITRLKQFVNFIASVRAKDLKSKEPRLRDWNWVNSRDRLNKRRAWNQKNLDYEIETVDRVLPRRCVHRWPWNQKNLDYEIETSFIPHVLQHLFFLEIKRTSITRLKLAPIERVEASIRTWNQKNLDYEIETIISHPGLTADHLRLEIKRTSITRLKQGIAPYRWNTGEFAWNQKNLDYEIETFSQTAVCISGLPWNQKNLDYEIETIK